MQSMTGYGKAEYVENGITLSVEIKTVNNRFLDIIPKYPRSFVYLDDIIRKTVQSKICRGRVELFISYEDLSSSGTVLTIDDGLVSAYVAAAKNLAGKYGVENDLTVARLLRFPDVVIVKPSETDEEKLKNILITTLFSALGKLNDMRAIEGEKLKSDILSRANTVEALVGELAEVAPAVKDNYALKLRERISEAMHGVAYDESRLLQEVAMFADKSDITEELTRLKSHISQLRTILSGEKDAGKKLDFLMQEFNRETNTVCSKANDADITKIGLALKNEIEKMREQVQNIE